MPLGRLNPFGLAGLSGTANAQPTAPQPQPTGGAASADEVGLMMSLLNMVLQATEMPRQAVSSGLGQVSNAFGAMGGTFADHIASGFQGSTPAVETTGQILGAVGALPFDMVRSYADTGQRVIEQGPQTLVSQSPGEPDPFLGIPVLGDEDFLNALDFTPLMPLAKAIKGIGALSPFIMGGLRAFDSAEDMGMMDANLGRMFIKIRDKFFGGDDAAAWRWFQERMDDNARHQIPLGNDQITGEPLVMDVLPQYDGVVHHQEDEFAERIMNRSDPVQELNDLHADQRERYLPLTAQGGGSLPTASIDFRVRPEADPDPFNSAWLVDPYSNGINIAGPMGVRSHVVGGRVHVEGIDPAYRSLDDVRRQGDPGGGVDLISGPGDTDTTAQIFDEAEKAFLIRQLGAADPTHRLASQARVQNADDLLVSLDQFIEFDEFGKPRWSDAYPKGLRSMTADEYSRVVRDAQAQGLYSGDDFLASPMVPSTSMMRLRKLFEFLPYPYGDVLEGRPLKYGRITGSNARRGEVRDLQRLRDELGRATDPNYVPPSQSLDQRQAAQQLQRRLSRGGKGMADKTVARVTDRAKAIRSGDFTLDDILPTVNYELGKYTLTASKKEAKRMLQSALDQGIKPEALKAKIKQAHKVKGGLPRWFDSRRFQQEMDSYDQMYRARYGQNAAGQLNRSTGVLQGGPLTAEDIEEYLHALRSGDHSNPLVLALDSTRFGPDSYRRRIGYELEVLGNDFNDNPDEIMNFLRQSSPELFERAPGIPIAYLLQGNAPR